MGLGEYIPDSWEETAEGAWEDVGEGIDSAGDFTGRKLDDWGLGGGDWVRDKTGSAANAMGADVGEMELGETEDEKQLVHGSPGKLRSTAKHLTDLRQAFERVGEGLKGGDSSGLKGDSADAFRERIAGEPPKWFKAADALEKAAKALNDMADTVAWAQGEAKEAVALHKRGKAASQAHESEVEAYEKFQQERQDPGGPAGSSTHGVSPEAPPATDPGVEDLRQARHLLTEARYQRDDVARRVRSRIRAARDEAPAKPDYDEQVSQGLDNLQTELSHVGGGAVKGAAGLLSFARSLNPQDPYNLAHPHEYATNLNSTVTGLVRSANNPGPALKSAWDAFQKDGWEFTGRALPEALGSKGAGMLRKGARLDRHVPEDRPSAHEQLRRDGPGQHDTPNDKRDCQGSDPIDFASGKMFLPQTDVALPGALPLVFRRRVESGYRAGRWFGPSWVSSIDQRLEIAAEGVVLVTDGGLLLRYPHPAPDVPTLPESGPRWLLERAPDGDYVLSLPEAGETWHFAGPADVGDDGEAPLVQITDRNGNFVTFEYGDDGTPTSIIHSGGYHLKLACQAGRVASLSLADAAEDGGDQVLYRYGYDQEGNLNGVLNPAGGVLHFEYDTERRVTAWVDSNNRRYEYAYDDRDRCISEGSPEGHVALRVDYDGRDAATGHRVTTATTGEGHVTRRVLNSAGKVVARTDPMGHTVQSTYDRFGELLSSTDELGRTVRIRRDDEGRAVAVIRPDSSEATVTYGTLGLPIETMGPDGARRHIEYDERGNRTSVTDPANNTTRYAYGEHGHLLSVTDALGGVTRVRCDRAGLPVEITDPNGGVTSYGRDDFGRPTAIVDPLGAVTRLVWNLDGQLACRIRPGGAEESWVYDGEGNCLSHTDANGGVTTYEYGHFDLLTAHIGPDGVRHEFTHDTELRLTQVINPQGLTWNYTYDPAGRLTSETDFDDRTVGYELDPAGQLTARTTALGQAIRFEYDELGRMVRKDAGGQVTTYTYDAAGRTTAAAGPDAEVIYQRDKLGRIKTELVNGRPLSHSYDALGRPTKRIAPSGATTTYAYDAAGNRTAVNASGHALDFTHDAAGRETGRLVGGSVQLSHIWDPAGRLTELAVTGPSAEAVHHRSYAYRPDGYLTGITDHVDSLDTRSFDLDAAGRVTAVHAQGWSESYAYDSAGNQTQADWPGQHTSSEAVGDRAYTGTRIRSAGRIRYEHDGAGRMVLRQKNRLSRMPDTWRYTWDAEDRLTAVITPDGSRWRYLYDPLGRRIAKQRLASDGATVAEQVDFTWHGPTLIEQTTTAPGLPDPVSLTWDHDGFQPIAQTERLLDETSQQEIDQRFFAIVTDLVGTPTELLDENGDIAWHTRTTLWGTTTWAADATAYTPLRFPGQYFDPETGLHYNVHRYYDPDTARYLSPDPLGLAPSPNPSAYVHNPHSWTDPLGLSPCPEKRGVFQRLKDSITGHDPAEAALRAPRVPMRLKDLEHVEMPDFGDPPWKEGRIRSLTDEDLIEAINNPDEKGSVVTVTDGMVQQGNHRMHEALRRMNLPDHKGIGPDTILYIL